MLQDIMKEIKEVKATAEMVVDTEHPSKMRVQKGKKAQAKEKLEELYFQYRKAIMGSALFILATGKNAKKYADLAAKEYQCVSVDADEVYNQTLDAIPTQVYMNKNASRELFEHMTESVRRRANEIDIVGFNAIVFANKYKKMLKSREEALDLVKTAINAEVGAELVGLDAIERASMQALKTDFKGTVMPIVLYSEDQKNMLQILKDLPRVTKSVFLVTVGQEVDEELQKQATTSLKNATKKQVEESLLTIRKSVL